jgi:hypothetical protein
MAPPYLKFVNRLLKSMASGIPGIEPIVELKDQCEEEIDDMTGDA